MVLTQTTVAPKTSIFSHVDHSQGGPVDLVYLMSPWERDSLLHHPPVRSITYTVCISMYGIFSCLLTKQWNTVDIILDALKSNIIPGGQYKHYRSNPPSPQEYPGGEDPHNRGGRRQNKSHNKEGPQFYDTPYSGHHNATSPHWAGPLLPLMSAGTGHIGTAAPLVCKEREIWYGKVPKDHLFMLC